MFNLTRKPSKEKKTPPGKRVPASRHTGVHFFVSHLASWLRTRRSSEPTFRPSGATNHCKNSACDFSTFSGTWIFFLLRLPLFDLLSSSLLFSSLTLTTSASPSVHIVGSLTSKLPICLSVCLPVSLSICLPVYLSS